MPAAPPVVRLAGLAAGGSAAAVGLAPALAMDVAYLGMAGSVGRAMENAVACQQRSQVLAGAAVAQVLALILAQGGKSS